MQQRLSLMAFISCLSQSIVLHLSERHDADALVRRYRLNVGQARILTESLLARRFASILMVRASLLAGSAMLSPQATSAAKRGRQAGKKRYTAGLASSDTANYCLATPNVRKLLGYP